MGYIFHPPLSGNPFPHNTGTKRRRPGVLRELDMAEESAFLTFGSSRQVFEKTRAVPDENRMFEARNIWSRLYHRILELEGAI